MAIIFLSIYFWATSFYVQEVLEPLFDSLPVFFWMRKFFYAFVAFQTFGFLLGAWSIVAPLSVLSMAFLLGVNAYGWSFAGQYVQRGRSEEALKPPVFELKNVSAGWSKAGVVVMASYAFLVIVSFFLLVISRTGAHIVTPWQTIHPAYIYVFLAATFLLGVLCVKKLVPSWAVIGCLVAYSLLLHSYLPLTHELVYGADQWRHMAVEARLMQGGMSTPILTLAPRDLWHDVFDPGRWSYAQFWTVHVFVARFFEVDLLMVNKWSVPIAWGIMMPLLLFEIGRALGFGHRSRLMFIWLGFLPFAWQAGGSFTLPVNWGFLWWLFLLLLLLWRTRNRQPGQVGVLLFFGCLSFFGYILYALLFWLAWATLEVVIIAESKQNWWVRWGIMEIAIIGVIIFIPVVELLIGYSHLPPAWNILTGVRQAVGNFSAFYLATGPRPHDIATGNILFNQVPVAAFVANIFTESLGYLVIFAVAFWLLVILGCAATLRDNRSAPRWLAVFMLGLYGSYFISRYIFIGEQILSRRLELALALGAVVFAFLGSRIIFTTLPWLKRLVPVVVLGVAIMITISYSLGPDTDTVSATDYHAMQTVWAAEKNLSHHCVIADTMSLLALEAISGQQIVGGGFPVGAGFVSTEREAALREIVRNPKLAVARAKIATGADHCQVVVSQVPLF